mmetsp:Transcript_15081/g.42860  ORF Transcript_15081/g.42860 Transcript_15081/m.42860 type:complete len:293 (+) Transcript_15081:1208-2086(+)
MRASVVLPDQHVLDRLPRTSHVHRVRQEGPLDAIVVELLLEHLVRMVSDDARDVVGLRGPTGRVHKHDAVFGHVRRVQGPDKELVVRPVDGVAALESHHIRLGRQHLSHLRRAGARKDALWQPEAVDLASQVVLTPLPGDHLHGGMLKARGAVALRSFFHLVRSPPALDVHDGDVPPLVRHQNLASGLDGIIIGIEHDRQSEEQPVGQPHLVDHRVVGVLVHEPVQGVESTHVQKLHIARLPLVQLDRVVAVVLCRRVRRHEIPDGVRAMGEDLPILSEHDLRRARGIRPEK